MLNTKTLFGVCVCVCVCGGGSQLFTDFLFFLGGVWEPNPQKKQKITALNKPDLLTGLSLVESN